MAKGQSTFDLRNGKKEKREFEPFEAGDKDLKLRGNSCEIRTAKPSERNPKPTPRIAVTFEALGTAKEEGDKNKVVFHDFHLSTVPGKDGKMMPMLVDGIKGFCDALGKFPSLEEIVHEGSGKKILDPKRLLSWLKEQDGEVVRARIGLQAASKEWPAKNIVKEFYEPEEGKNAEDDDEDEDEDDDDNEKDEEREDENDEDDDEDEKPARKKLKKRN